MEWILLLGLAVVGGLLVVAMMRLLRPERGRRLPTWLPVAGMVVTAALLVVAVLDGEAFAAFLFLLNLLVFSMLLGMSRRPPAP